MNINRQFFSKTLSVLMLAFSSVFAPAHSQTPAYEIEFAGAPAGIDGALRSASELNRSNQNRMTPAALRRSARRDIERFAEVLRSAGYYEGEASFEFSPAAGRAPPKIKYEISPNRPFTIVEYEILYEDDSKNRPINFAGTGITPDNSAAGAALRDSQSAFLIYLKDNGFPLAQIIARRAIANYEDATAHAVFVFKSGPRVRYGNIEFQGVQRANPDFLRKLEPWELGDEFEQSKLITYRQRLLDTAIFSDVRARIGDPNADGVAPINVTVTERKHRTIGAGASFSTSEGPGGRLFFENRNLFGQGENLRIELSASRLEQAINFDVAKPVPALPGLAFGNFEFSNENTEAFDARTLKLSGGVSKRWFADRLTTSGAIALETSNLVIGDVEERNYFVSSPLTIYWNSENDILNPTTGFRAGVTLTPYTGSETFTQTEISGRGRYFLGANDQFTIAARGRLGATFANTLANLPQNKRLFAGGGGSVRGYGFQEAGPLDIDNNPIGGRSLIDAGLEFRAQISHNIQLAAFVDAGNVSENSLPDFNGSFFVGAGGGVRYLTAIGPIRADIAFPLDKRPSDSDFQLYISLGQPF